MRRFLFTAMLPLVLPSPSARAAEPTLPAGTSRAYQVAEDARFVHIETPELAAAIRKRGYVSGVANQSFLDKKTGSGSGLWTGHRRLDHGARQRRRLSRPPGTR